MKIVSWNVNSIRARLDHVTTWLKANRPDVLFLQELKTTEFPATAFTELARVYRPKPIEADSPRAKILSRPHLERV